MTGPMPICAIVGCTEVAETNCDDYCGQWVCDEHIQRDYESATRVCDACNPNPYARPLPPALFVRGE
jgi:hypothetical protein